MQTAQRVCTYELILYLIIQPYSTGDGLCREYLLWRIVNQVLHGAVLVEKLIAARLFKKDSSILRNRDVFVGWGNTSL